MLMVCFPEVEVMLPKGSETFLTLLSVSSNNHNLGIGKEEIRIFCDFWIKHFH